MAAAALACFLLGLGLLGLCSTPLTITCSRKGGNVTHLLPKSSFSYLEKTEKNKDIPALLSANLNIVHIYLFCTKKTTGDNYPLKHGFPL